MRIWTTVALAAACVSVSGLPACGRKAAPAPTPTVTTWPARMKVVVSIAPLKGLIEPLLPPGSTVTVLIPPNTSEHGYELPPAQQQEAIKADLLVWIGMEEKIDAVSKENQRATRVDVRLADALGIEVHDDDHDHDHGKGEAEGGKPGGGAHEHEHGGEGDPHVWLDPQQAKLIVRAVAKKVAAARPAAGGEGGAGPDEVTAAVDAMCTRLDGLDKEYRDGLAGATTRTIVVGHDAFGWLARRYDLKTVAISGLTAAEPTPGDLQRAREAVKTNGLKAVFKEPQLDPAAAKSIAEATGAQVLTLDPLGDGDYFLMMRTNLKAIRTALGLEK